MTKTSDLREEFGKFSYDCKISGYGTEIASFYAKEWVGSIIPFFPELYTEEDIDNVMNDPELKEKKYHSIFVEALRKKFTSSQER